MDRASGVLIEEQRVARIAPPPRLQLLIEWESRPRVFFDNLADLLFRRQPPPLRITSRPGRFWSDVFVRTAVPWTSFIESMLWHALMLVLFIWGQSRVWTPVKVFQNRDSYHQRITYYPPPETYRAAESRVAEVRPHMRRRESTRQPVTQQPPIHVRQEQLPALVTPPDIKEAAARLPNLVGSHPVTPMAPFSASVGSRRDPLRDASSVVAPPPQVDQAKLDPANNRQLALPQPPAVAPAPELGTASARASKASPGGLRIVPPPPSVQNDGNKSRGGQLTAFSGGGPNVVPPSPSVQGNGSPRRDSRSGSLAGGSSQVVAPPPSFQGEANPSDNGRWSSLTPGGPNVVPPSPSVTGAGNTRDARAMAGGSSQVVAPPPAVQGGVNPSRTGQLNSLSGGGPSVVPPFPSVAGAGVIKDAKPGSFFGSGSQVIPPPASIQSAGAPAAGGTLSRSLSGAGTDVVPPAPSIGGGGSSNGATRMASLSGDSATTPPAPSVQGAGKTGPLQPMDDPPVVASSPAPAGPNEDKATIEELPLNFLGLVLAAPGTSYFSNFEVFVAKRRVAKNQLQLIKLVYQFLPYQRRLSEYDLNNLPPRIIKLRVTPDPGCDESLGQIIEPTPDPARPVTEYPKLPPALSAADLTEVLPCYRTTADDFQKAMSHVR